MDQMSCTMYLITTAIKLLPSIQVLVELVNDAIGTNTGYQYLIYWCIITTIVVNIQQT